MVGNTDDGRKYIDPRLLALMDGAENKGFFFEKLNKGDVVEIQTMNNVYTLKILDPKNLVVEMTSTNPRWSGPEKMRVVGTTLTGWGTMVKLGWHAPGYRLILDGTLESGLKDLTLSLTRIIKINGEVIAEVSPHQRN